MRGERGQIIDGEKAWSSINRSLFSDFVSLWPGSGLIRIRRAKWTSGGKSCSGCSPAPTTVSILHFTGYSTTGETLLTGDKHIEIFILISFFRASSLWFFPTKAADNRSGKSPKLSVIVLFVYQLIEKLEYARWVCSRLWV
jgi:hypothetical protein